MLLRQRFLRLHRSPYWKAPFPAVSPALVTILGQFIVLKSPLPAVLETKNNKGKAMSISAGHPCVRVRTSLQLLSALVLTASSAHLQAEVDLNGLWFPSGGAAQEPRETPFNAYGKGLFDAYVAAFEVDDDPGGWCVSPGLPRSIWGAPFPVEIVQTEAFINMFWEGYFQYRKIYMDGHPRPDPILHTGMGYSVGRWEGDTLVVETSYLREYPYMRRLPNTDTATIVERITVENRPNTEGESNRYLKNQLTLTDPRLYTQPVSVTASLVWSPDTPIMEYSCSEAIYDQHLQQNGLQVPDFNQ